ncbi:MAG: hypothetical protein EXR07_00505 [Acetobacteraceae bacterium]|nr:hypothetical protein [Acetobacteraceae bacterium]
MRDNVLTADVADESLKAERLTIEHETGFFSLPRIAKAVGAEKQAEFEGHVETGQAFLVRFGTRQIVDAPAAIADKGRDFIDANIAAVIGFEGASGPRAARENSECQRVPEMPISRVERAVDKDVVNVCRRRLPDRRTSIRRR